MDSHSTKASLNVNGNTMAGSFNAPPRLVLGQFDIVAAKILRQMAA